MSWQPRYYPISELWLRLYAHALLRESRIFPDIELCDESPGYLSNGFADIWKGYYHGESVCVRVIRTQDPTPLTKIKKVFNPLISSETYSVCFVPDIQSCKRRGQGQSSSQRSPCHRGFGDIVPTLHHEPMDAEWEHCPVHTGEPRCQSVNSGTCPSG